MIFSPAPLTHGDTRALEEIQGMRAELADFIRVPRRWTGGLRRHSLAKAIRGSNSIEGYVVDVDDAAAALDDEDALSADEQTFAEIRGYRQALGYILATATDEDFVIDASTLKSMHYMLLGHDLSKSPGRYRPGPIYVHDERDDTVVYEGPPSDEVSALVAELVESLLSSELDPIVQGAMAHLNLVMIHPFRDGNGRLARALQTLVLARRGLADPTFSSIEEWLGANTDAYYRVLALTADGGWNPARDTGLWISFNIRAHHMQAQTLRRRMLQAIAMWAAIEAISSEHSLPERAQTLLFEATLGYRLRRSTYVKHSEIEERTASRDLKLLVDAGLLRAIGETKGRHYVAGPSLDRLKEARKTARLTMVDPMPELLSSLTTR